MLPFCHRRRRTADVDTPAVQVWLELGEDWKAVCAAQRAVQLAPSWPEAHLTLARAQVRGGGCAGLSLAGAPHARSRIVPNQHTTTPLVDSSIWESPSWRWTRWRRCCSCGRGTPRRQQRWWRCARWCCSGGRRAAQQRGSVHAWCRDRAAAPRRDLDLRVRNPEQARVERQRRRHVQEPRRRQAAPGGGTAASGISCSARPGAALSVLVVLDPLKHWNAALSEPPTSRNSLRSPSSQPQLAIGERSASAVI